MHIAVSGTGLIYNNSHNFVVQPRDDPGSTLSVFVVATQDLLASNNEGFLDISWATLVDLPKADSAFTFVVVGLKEKQSSKAMKKHSTRSQAGPKKSFL